jgi:hypothetical protein
MRKNGGGLGLPLGYEPDSDELVEGESKVIVTDQKAKAQQLMMQTAYAPAKGIFTTGFMLYMSGSSIQIFSIMSTGMALKNPLMAMIGVNQQFKRFEGEGVDTLLPKCLFLGLQLVCLCVALYKCHTMGLLPMTAADWISSLSQHEYSESAGHVV